MAETRGSEPSRGAPQSENNSAIRIANTRLNDWHADPDSDESVLARQFLRAIEREAERTALLEALKRIRAAVGTSTEAWHIAEAVIRKAEGA